MREGEGQGRKLEARNFGLDDGNFGLEGRKRNSEGRNFHLVSVDFGLEARDFGFIGMDFRSIARDFGLRSLERRLRSSKPKSRRNARDNLGYLFGSFSDGDNRAPRKSVIIRSCRRSYSQRGRCCRLWYSRLAQLSGGASGLSTYSAVRYLTQKLSDL